jgi:hypothetical protein
MSEHAVTKLLRFGTSSQVAAASEALITAQRWSSALAADPILHRACVRGRAHIVSALLRASPSFAEIREAVRPPPPPPAPYLRLFL